MRGAFRWIGAWLPALAGTTVVLGFAAPPPSDPAQARAREVFRQQVLPMLQTRCLNCHGDGEELEGDLDLRSRAAVLRGGKNGPALDPGNALGSLLYQSTRRTDEKMMPPRDRDRVTPEESAALKTWIEAGAPWETGDGR